MGLVYAHFFEKNKSIEGKEEQREMDIWKHQGSGEVNLEEKYQSLLEKYSKTEAELQETKAQLAYTRSKFMELEEFCTKLRQQHHLLVMKNQYNDKVISKLQGDPNLRLPFDGTEEISPKEEQKEKDLVKEVFKEKRHHKLKNAYITPPTSSNPSTPSTSSSSPFITPPSSSSGFGSPFPSPPSFSSPFPRTSSTSFLSFPSPTSSPSFYYSGGQAHPLADDENQGNQQPSHRKPTSSTPLPSPKFDPFFSSNLWPGGFNNYQ